MKHDSNTGLGMKIKNATHKSVPDNEYNILKLKNVNHYYEEGISHKSNKYEEVKTFIKAFIAAGLLLGLILLILKLTGGI